MGTTELARSLSNAILAGCTRNFNLVSLVIETLPINNRFLKKTILKFVYRSGLDKHFSMLYQISDKRFLHITKTASSCSMYC
jgi:hypothetical protein